MVFSVEELNLWTIEDLRKFLSDRGVPLSAGSCRKAELIEKVIFAEKLELPVLPSRDDRLSEISSQRQENLTVGGVKIPYPEDLKCHWFQGSQYFPDLTIDVITEYAEKTASMKGFREGINLHFSGHVHSVFFHRITDTIKFCFIKGEVVPQTRISEKPYSVWVCLRNDCGFILTGECGCVAGYSSSCKHIFALLHYIEHEVKLGHNKSCTGKTQQWSVKVSKKSNKIHTPCELSSVQLNRPHPENDDLPPSKHISRNTYEPRSLGDLDVKFTEKDWEELTEATDGSASVLQFRTTFSEKLNSLPSSSPPSPPPTIFDVASYSNVNSFHTVLKSKRSSKEIKIISQMTNKQSDCDHWFQYRQCVITASIAHEVLRKVNKDSMVIAKQASKNLCAKICGYTKPTSSKALSWGKINEEYARKRYIRKTKPKHKHFLCQTSGLFISEQYPIIGASPDGIIKCLCCAGFGVLECKCPWGSRDKFIDEYILTPSSCLARYGSTIVLQPNHPYHTQVQHQMYVTGADYCDFEVFLPKESCTVRVKKDPMYAVERVPKFLTFFDAMILPELYSKEILTETVCKNTLYGLVNQVVEKIEQETILTELQQLSAVKGNLSAPEPSSRKRKPQQTSVPLPKKT